MKITVNTKEIKTAITKLLKVTLKKSSLPILEGIKITTDNQSIQLTATDIDVTSVLTLKESEIVNTGEIVLDKETLKLIQKMKSNTLTITEEEITADKRKINFTGHDPELYPITENENQYVNHAFTITEDRMKSITDTTFACYKEQDRPTLTGVCFRKNQTFACDSHRLALRDIPENQLEKDIIIPAYALNLITALTDKKYKGEYVASVDEDYRKIKIEFDNITMQIRLIEGIYSDVSKLIPQTFNNSIQINKNELVEELKLMSEISEYIHIEFNNNKIYLMSKSEDGRNRLTAEVNALHSIQEIQEMKFNVKLLLEGLTHNNNDTITFNIDGQITPAMIDNNYLVLPYRFKKAA